MAYWCYETGNRDEKGGAAHVEIMVSRDFIGK